MKTLKDMCKELEGYVYGLEPRPAHFTIDIEDDPTPFKVHASSFDKVGKQVIWEMAVSPSIAVCRLEDFLEQAQSWLDYVPVAVPMSGKYAKQPLHFSGMWMSKGILHVVFSPNGYGLSRAAMDAHR